MSTYAAAETSQYGGAPIELYRFTMGPLTEWHYTSADVEVLHALQTYAPAIIHRNEISGTQEETDGVVEVLIDPKLAFAEQLVRGTTPVPIGLTIIRRHRGQAEAQAATVFVGEVGSVELGDELMKLTCLPLQRSVQRRVPRMLYQTMCNNNLYDPICGIDPGAYTDTVVITSVSNSGRTITINVAPHPDGWYNGGWVQLGSQRAFIMDHAGLTLQLLTPLVGGAVDTEIDVVAGCDRMFTTCRDKFDNLENFMGFPKIPSRNPFEGLT